ncbi:hypothetical protein [Micromonospora sp. WMMD710]|uniref:hypothetical protein n=1 Tax=Micromonospora sp. WMMD710 TaxID=3016085 RepID=UPI0024170A6D|nr:hypothetical protein [Micromonospora sp. WMMD710]MDG4757470.1 hypothetical protein [Micromonospora sp. WMMD710]
MRDVVAELAPDELVLVDALHRFDDDTVVRRLTRRRPGREPLGFGLAETAALVTPLVWIALDETVRLSVGAGASRAGSGVGGWLRARLRRKAPPQPMAPLTVRQLQAVRDRVVELGVPAGLTPEEADLLGDRVVARLVLAVDGDPSGPGEVDQAGRD